MRFLSLCIYIGILFIIIDVTLARQRNDENDIPISEELDEKDYEYLIPIKSNKKMSAKSKKKGSDEDDENNNVSDEDTDYLYACTKHGICKCETDTLHCEKQMVGSEKLESTEIEFPTEDEDGHPFTAKFVNFRNNAIKELNKVNNLKSEIKLISLFQPRLK